MPDQGVVVIDVEGGPQASPNLLSDGLLKWEYLVGSRQVTDAYLLALAVHHDGRLVMFEPAATTNVVRGTTEQHLVVL